MSTPDLVGKKRTRNIIYARQIAIYLSRQMLDLPFNDIGKEVQPRPLHRHVLGDQRGRRR